MDVIEAGARARAGPGGMDPEPEVLPWRAWTARATLRKPQFGGKGPLQTGVTGHDWSRLREGTNATLATQDATLVEHEHLN